MNHVFGFIVFETEGKDPIGPIEDPYGFTIVQVMKRDYGPANKTFTQAKKELEFRITARKKDANYRKWIDKIRAKVPVKKFIN